MDIEPTPGPTPPGPMPTPPNPAGPMSPDDENTEKEKMDSGEEEEMSDTDKEA